MTYDKIILGAGLYGLYAAQKCGAAGQRVLVLERDPAPFMRATYINQARVHMGYHYPAATPRPSNLPIILSGSAGIMAFACIPSLTRSTPPAPIFPGRMRPSSDSSAARRASAATMCRRNGTLTTACVTARF